MEFNGYSSLENHHNGKFITKVRDEGFTAGEWVAREKIHGTNFSVLITPDLIQPCKRSGPILPSESFFGYEIIMKRYKESFEKMKELLDFYNLEFIQVFGEFAGGGIQKEVDYGEKEFYVFDIMIKGVDGLHYIIDSGEGGVEDLANHYGFKMAPLLGRGKFEDLIKIPNDFQSRVNDFNALASGGNTVETNKTVWEVFADEEGPNVSEGYVLKPNKPAYLPNGSRVAIKCKNSKFSEKKKLDKLIQPPKELSEIDADVLTKFSEYVTWNRVSNVVSKWGEVTAKDFGKVMGLTLQDIFVEAEREGLEISQAEDPALVKKQLQKLVQEVIRERWSELLTD